MALLHGVFSFKEDASPAVELLLEFFDLLRFLIVKKNKILRNDAIKDGSSAVSAFDDHLIVFQQRLSLSAFRLEFSSS